MIVGGSTFEAFIKCTKDKRVVAFSASDFLQLISMNYKELNLDKKIDYVVDNDTLKYGKSILVNGIPKTICSIEMLKKERCEEVVLLIASDAYVYEIYEQLQKIEELNNMVFFALPILIAKHSDWKEVNIVSESSGIIPKKIHCFWFSQDEKTELAKKCIESWRKYCPDYEIIEWNSQNYDVKKNSYMYQAYLNRNWAYVSDYARLDVLYNYGGVYMDLDVELLKSLDGLLKHDFFIGFGPIRDIEAAVFGSKPGNKLLLDMLYIYKTKEFDPKKGTNLLNVQPVYLDCFFASKGFLINGEYQEKDGVAIYPREIFSARNWFTGDNQINDASVGVHHCIGGWASEKSKVRKEIKFLGNKKMEEICK